MKLRREKGRWVHPDTHEIVKFLPNDPPERGDRVLVDGLRCRVLACPVEWDGLTWQMGNRGVKVTPEDR
jgi:hypothetical protein